MIEKIKKAFSFLFKNKKAIFAFLFLIFLGSLLPLEPVSAASWWDYLIGAFQRSSIRSIASVLFVLVGISNALVVAAGNWLTAVISNDFILNTISYTNPGGAMPNLAIKAGLNVTQGFANMVLVLVLVFIALAVILRLRDYEAKKLLPTFIIVALLVNFAPVISGLVVDASNIVMNYFLNKGAGYQLLANQQIMTGQAVIAFAGTWLDFDAVSQRETLLFMILVIGINFALFLILAIFAFVFIARHLAIWLLVILSPLAFVAYILPHTRDLAKKWWTQLVHWSFVGVTCAFFLYLGSYFINTGIMTNQLGLWRISLKSVDALPFLIATAFLYMGLTFGLKTSAIGAGAVMGYVAAKGRAIGMTPIKAGKWAGKWAGKKAAKGVWSNIEARGGVKEKVQKATRAVEKIPILRWFVPETVKKYGEFRADIEKETAEAMDTSTPKNLENVFSGAAIGKKAVGKILSVIKKNDANDIFKDGKEWFGVDTDEELLNHPKFKKIMQKVIRMAKNAGLHNSILRSSPRLAQLLADQSWAGDYANMSKKAAVARAISEARDQHIGNWEPEEFNSVDMIEGALAHLDRERWLLVNRKIKRGQEYALEAMNSAFSDWIDEQRNAGRTILQGQENNYFKEYRKKIKKENKGMDGYFTAMEDTRFQKTGWKLPEYIKEEDRWRKKGISGASPFAPGTTAGMGTPPPSKEGERRPKRKRFAWLFPRRREVKETGVPEEKEEKREERVPETGKPEKEKKEKKEKTPETGTPPS